MKKISYCLFFILCIMIIFMNLLILNKNKKIKDLVNEIEALQTINIEQNYLLENVSIISKLQHYSEGRCLKNYTLYTDIGDSCKIKDLCLTKKLVFYFSEQSCQICYLHFFEKLRMLSEKIGRNNILVIGKFSKKRSLHIFIQDLDFDINFDIFRVEEDFEIYPEYNDYAQVFFLDKELIIDNICIIDKSNQDLCDDYLSVIENKFNEK